MADALVFSFMYDVLYKHDIIMQGQLWNRNGRREETFVESSLYDQSYSFSREIFGFLNLYLYFPFYEFINNREEVKSQNIMLEDPWFEGNR